MCCLFDESEELHQHSAEVIRNSQALAVLISFVVDHHRDNQCKLIKVVIAFFTGEVLKLLVVGVESESKLLYSVHQFFEGLGLRGHRGVSTVVVLEALFALNEHSCLCATHELVQVCHLSLNNGK